MKKFIYLLSDEQFQDGVDTTIDTAIMMGIKSVSDLGIHLGNIHFIICYALAGILRDDNNEDIRDKLVQLVYDMCNDKEDFVSFDYLHEYLVYCLSKKYITEEEYEFLSKFRFFYIHNGIYKIT